MERGGGAVSWRTWEGLLSRWHRCWHCVCVMAQTPQPALSMTVWCGESGLQDVGAPLESLKIGHCPVWTRAISHFVAAHFRPTRTRVTTDTICAPDMRVTCASGLPYGENSVMWPRYLRCGLLSSRCKLRTKSTVAAQRRRQRTPRQSVASSPWKTK